ncbi:MAG: magnesium transporter [Clostridia bacterium]|nr:magnesium transporter [Clostridia bacterium]
MFEKISELMTERMFGQIRTILSEAQPADVADFFEELPQEDAVRLFRLMPKEEAAESFSYMSTETQKKIVDAITDRELSGILDELFLDDTVDMIEEMPANVVKRVLANSDPDTRRLINHFLQYGEDTAGSLMTIEFVDLHRDMTVRDAFERIRKTGVDKETIYTCYVTDKNRVLDGLVTVRTLLLSDMDSVIGDIMDTNVVFTSTGEDKEEIAAMFAKYDLLSVPVVDNERRLVGIITVDDAVEVMQEENTEDFEKMAAITPSDDPYLKVSTLQHVKNRVLWLLLLMISATFTGAIITHFQSLFSTNLALVSFIPMLMNTGGNCGSQVSTLVIRGMALDEIRGRDVLRVLWKEIRISVIVGAILAAVIILSTWVTRQDLSLALTVGLSLYATVIVAKSVGCLLPIGAKQLHLDPAIMASPIITTVVDMCALLLYFTVAKSLMGL